MDGTQEACSWKQFQARALSIAITRGYLSNSEATGHSFPCASGILVLFQHKFNPGIPFLGCRKQGDLKWVF